MRQSIVITAVLLICASTVFVVSAMLFAGSETGLHFAWLVGAGSVWLGDLVFTASVAWHAGQHYVDRHAYPKMLVPPLPSDSDVLRRVVPYRPAAPQRQPGYVPMSQRPAETTRIDLETWKPPVAPSDPKE